MKGRYRVRLTDARGHEVRRIRLPCLWGFIWTDGRYYDRKPGTRTYQARAWSCMVTCRGCGKVLVLDNYRVADGCPCNTPRGVNHGLVPTLTCTCEKCDPAQTGSTRYALLSVQSP